MENARIICCEAKIALTAFSWLSPSVSSANFRVLEGRVLGRTTSSALGDNTSITSRLTAHDQLYAILSLGDGNMNCLHKLKAF
jgi:hypothetical protein